MALPARRGSLSPPAPHLRMKGGILLFVQEFPGSQHQILLWSVLLLSPPCDLRLGHDSGTTPRGRDPRKEASAPSPPPPALLGLASGGPLSPPFASPRARLEGTTPLTWVCRPRKIPPCVFLGRTFCQLHKHRRIAFENEIYCWQGQFKW